MSDRRIAVGSTALADTLRDILDRLDRIDQGGAIAGRISFGPVIQIGDVQISILTGVGTQRTVEFRNLLSGATSTIVL